MFGLCLASFSHMCSQSSHSLLTEGPCTDGRAESFPARLPPPPSVAFFLPLPPSLFSYSSLSIFLLSILSPPLPSSLLPLQQSWRRKSHGWQEMTWQWCWVDFGSSLSCLSASVAAGSVLACPCQCPCLELLGAWLAQNLQWLTPLCCENGGPLALLAHSATSSMESQQDGMFSCPITSLGRAPSLGLGFCLSGPPACSGCPSVAACGRDRPQPPPSRPPNQPLQTGQESASGIKTPHDTLPGYV